MSIFEVLVNTDDLVVLGPPAVIDVGIDIGPEGQRGATFYAGSGNPNDTAVSENVFGDVITPAAGDLYINTATGANYGWLYIYNPKVSGDQWDSVLQLQPPQYSTVTEQTFTTGTVTIAVDLDNILPTGTTVASAYDFAVNMTAISANPTLLTIVSQTLTLTQLEIEVSGMKYESAAWSDLNAETIDISLNITVV